VGFGAAMHTCRPRIHNNGGFSEEELDSRKHIIYSNTVNAMNQLLQGMAQLNIGFSVEANEVADASRLPMWLFFILWALISEACQSRVQH